jgi:hypothetical protein
MALLVFGTRRILKLANIRVSAAERLSIAWQQFRWANAQSSRKVRTFVQERTTLTIRISN